MAYAPLENLGSTEDAALASRGLGKGWRGATDKLSIETSIPTDRSLSSLKSFYMGNKYNKINLGK